MLKKILAVVAMLYAAASFAAVDVNKASAADLDGVKGIGPAISKTIVDERKKGGEFKSWDDFMARVKGIKEAKATALSKEGLTVNGSGFKSASAMKKEAKKEAKAEKKEEKAMAKAEKKAEKKEEKAAAAKPTASAKPAASAKK